MRGAQQRVPTQGETVYESFFNLEHKPFELIPNPRFLYLSAAHRKALNYLTYGIRQQSGFILLTGEVGTGKTTLIRSLIKSQLTDVTLSKIFNTKVEAQQLIEMILEDFGVRPTSKDKPSLLRELNDFLIDQYARGRQCVLIIDEAQNLTHELLEEVRMLSNLENDQQKLLRIILVGQPELKTLLAAPELLQLRQRIQVNCHIPPLPAEEIEDYIVHRLEFAGNRDAAAFAPEAFEAIHRYTRGVPRLINILCDYLLLDAFANETRTISAASVHEVAGDLNFDNQYWNPITPLPEDELPGGAAKTPSHASSRASAKITSLLKNLNGRLKNIEHALPRLENVQKPPVQDTSELSQQLASFNAGLQTRMDEMWQAIGTIAEEVHSLKLRIDDGPISQPLSHPISQPLSQPVFTPLDEPETVPQSQSDIAPDHPPVKTGWMKRLIFKTS